MMDNNEIKWIAVPGTAPAKCNPCKENNDKQTATAGIGWQGKYAGRLSTGNSIKN